MTKPHGVDFGRYTEWEPPEAPPRPIDFVIAGITDGFIELPTFEANKPFLLNVKRLIAYHFFRAVSAVTQAENFLYHAAQVQPKALAVDWEDTRYHKLTENDVYTLVELFDLLKEHYERVILYSNIDDFELIVKYAPEFAKTVDLWIAYPPPPVSVNYEKTDWEDWPIFDEKRLGRPWSSVLFLQYSWYGHAPSYGAVNNKQEMDLNVFLGTMEELDEYLNIESETTEENEETGKMDLIKIDQILANQETIIEQQKEIFAAVQGVERNLASAYLDLMAAVGGGAQNGDSSDPGEQGGSDGDIYPHLKFMQGSKDFAPMYRLYPVTNDNGVEKWKADKIDGDYIEQGDIVKLLATAGTKILADGHDINKDMRLASNLEYPALNAARDAGRLMYIEATINGKLQKGVMAYDPSINKWWDTAKKEYWTI